MAKIFESGELSKFLHRSATESVHTNRAIFDSAVERSKSILNESFRFDANKIRVFISHKHSELKNLTTLIEILENQYNVECYIDSQDPSLPKVTSGLTAERIKNVISKCDKFILLATNGAVDSKWCNWELGFGDGEKSMNNVAILPIKDEGQLDQSYRGHEYMSIYSTITEASNVVYDYGTFKTVAALYVDDKARGRISLRDWLRY